MNSEQFVKTSVMVCINNELFQGSKLQNLMYGAGADPILPETALGARPFGAGTS